MNADASNTIYRKRLFVNRLALILAMAAMAIGKLFLAWILYVLLSRGFGGLSASIFTQMTPPPGSEGGLANAIFGSFMMVGFAALIATPIGILAGVYLAEYGNRGWVGPATRFINDILLSAPSIVVGLFIYTVYVVTVKHFSGWAGTFALSLLAIARISGETAPLLFTALNNQFGSTDMNAPMANLPVVIFQFAMSPFENWQALAWAAALLITTSVLGLNILARTIFAQ